MNHHINKLSKFIFNSLENINAIRDKNLYHQLSRVLRLESGSQIIAICDSSFHLLEIVTFREPEHIQFKYIEKIEQPSSELKQNIKIYLPLIKKDKIDWIIQKCTELGVTEFQFVALEHSVRQNINWEHQIERWNRIIKEAVEQSERMFVPIVHSGLLELYKIDFQKTDEINIVFLERAAKNPKNPENINNKKINLFFGPEGGFSSKERDFFIQNNFEIYSLGNRILRTETAIIAGAVLLANQIEQLD